MGLVTLHFGGEGGAYNRRIEQRLEHQKGKVIQMVARATASKTRQPLARVSGGPVRKGKAVEGREEELTVRRDRFVRVAPKRVRKAIWAIRMVARLGGGNYRPTKEEIQKIVSALDEEIEEMKRKLAGETEEKTVEFEL